MRYRPGLMLIAMLVISGLLQACGASVDALPHITPWQPKATAESSDLPVVVSEPDPDGVELVGVSLAREEGFIVVQFRAPPGVTGGWSQGSIFVIDEATKAAYKEVPVMPKIGPLFGRPQEEGQLGYVMLFNYQEGVKPGAAVSVIMGRYQREHVTVQP